MPEAEIYSAGGFIPDVPTRVTLPPDECVISFKTYECGRIDHKHNPSEGEQRRARAAMALDFFRNLGDDEQRE